MDAGQHDHRHVAKYRAFAVHKINRTAGILGIFVFAYALAISLYSWTYETAQQIGNLTTIADLIGLLDLGEKRRIVL